MWTAVRFEFDGVDSIVPDIGGEGKARPLIDTANARLDDVRAFETPGITRPVEMLGHQSRIVALGHQLQQACPI